MVCLQNLLLQKHVPEQMSWSAADSDVVHYKEICEKCLHSNYVTTHKNLWEIFSILPIAFPLLMWRFKLMRCLTSYIQVDALFDIVHSAMGDRKIPRTEEAWAALHMLGALHWSYNAQKLFYIYSSWKFWVCVLKKTRDSSLRGSFSASCFSMAIWNDWKRKSFRQEVMQKGGNWTKHYDWTAG